MTAADIEMGVSKRDLYATISFDVDELDRGVQGLMLGLTGFPDFIRGYILDGEGDWYREGERLDRFPRRDEFRHCEWKWRIGKSDI